ncbi:bifunctional glutamate N-acetyltransferase/amino-acid acetyltransferase ArgJ [bacterium]|nr:bifunctional glutamate N-acetyltransferase/amino-acid acetyltransferase ArgJ [bacterium]
MSKKITDIHNVYAHAVESGIKKEGLDLAYIYLPTAVATAGVFTQHVFKASSITYTQACMTKQVIKAVVINAGNANAVTGVQGEHDTCTIAETAAAYLGLNKEEVAVASTGIIGVNLPMGKIKKGLKTLCVNPQETHADHVAEAMLTTDLTKKEVWVEQQIGNHVIQVAGLTKGSGMIAPNMATTLGFLVTNAGISQEQLQDVFTACIDESYNMMSVDTDTSTNDMALCFATGECPLDSDNKDEMKAFKELLKKACVSLAVQIAKDGEGASKLIEVQVIQAKTTSIAKRLAKQVVDSPLVKTAIHGEDPNWGRFIMALGKGNPDGLDPACISISIGNYTLIKNGAPEPIDRELVAQTMNGNHVILTIDCGVGNAKATAWGCDLTHGYITINTEYN